MADDAVGQVDPTRTQPSVLGEMKFSPGCQQTYQKLLASTSRVISLFARGEDVA